MPWPCDPVFLFDQCSRESERVDPNSSHRMNCTTTETPRGIRDCCHRHEHQSMVAHGGVDTELPGAFEEDAIDLAFGHPD
jgi:hypothetical protein